MICDNIDYNYLETVKKHYVEKGYKYIEVPWVVSHKAISVTVPRSISVKNDIQPVASGEQSFIDLALEKVLPTGPHCCVTPCFRLQDTQDDGLHFIQFVKLELIDYFAYTEPRKYSLDRMIGHVLDYLNLNLITERRVMAIDDGERNCKTTHATDIEIQMKSGPRTGEYIEFGSYGIRYHDDVGWWVYGTGVALPRFQYIKEYYR